MTHDPYHHDYDNSTNNARPNNRSNCEKTWIVHGIATEGSPRVPLEPDGPTLRPCLDDVPPGAAASPSIVDEQELFAFPLTTCLAEHRADRAKVFKPHVVILVRDVCGMSCACLSLGWELRGPCARLSHPALVQQWIFNIIEQLEALSSASNNRYG